MYASVTVRLQLLLTVALTAVVQSSTDADKHRPRNVVVQVINETTVRLEWSRPKSAELAVCPVRRYTVRLRSDDTGLSRTWKVAGDRHSVTLYGLERSSSYQVRVLAVVCHGKSRPSTWLAVRTVSRRSTDVDKQPITDQQERSLPGKPSYVRTRTFSESVMVSWMSPDDGDLVRGYMVGYGEGVPDVNWRYVDAASNNVTIGNLKSATQYIISLRAFNNQGKGPVVYDLIYTRDAAGPTLASPVHLQSKVLSSSTIWLEWKDPSVGDEPDTRYYNVHYRPLISNDRPLTSAARRTLSVVVRAGHVVFYDLTPGTRYEFKVRTVKDAVASAFSQTIVNKTFETAPSSAPRSVTVSINHSVSGTVTVNWRPPRLPNGDITGYTVLYTDDSQLPADQWHVKSVNGAETQTSVNNLTTNVTYHLRVQARNSVGLSPPSSNTVFYMKPLLTPASAASSADELTSSTTSSLNQTASTMTSLDDVTDGSTQQPSAAKTKRDDERPADVDYNDPQHAAVPEHAARQHAPRARGRGGEGGVSFRSVVEHHVSAFITWSEPCRMQQSSHSTLVHYRLRYSSAASSTPIDVVTLDSNVALIDGLQASTEYWYQLQYVYDDGTHSPWTDKQLLKT